MMKTDPFFFPINSEYLCHRVVPTPPDCAALTMRTPRPRVICSGKYRQWREPEQGQIESVSNIPNDQAAHPVYNFLRLTEEFVGCYKSALQVLDTCLRAVVN
jgi:hypothetical protein